MKVKILVVLCLILGGFSQTQAQSFLLPFSPYYSYYGYGIPYPSGAKAIIDQSERDRVLLRDEGLRYEAERGRCIDGSPYNWYASQISGKPCSGLSQPFMTIPSGINFQPNICVLEMTSKKPGFGKTVKNILIRSGETAIIGAMAGVGAGILGGDVKRGAAAGAALGASGGGLQGYLESQYPDYEIKTGPCQPNNEIVTYRDGANGSSLRREAIPQPQPDQQSIPPSFQSQPNRSAVSASKLMQTYWDQPGIGEWKMYIKNQNGEIIPVRYEGSNTSRKYLEITYPSQTTARGWVESPPLNNREDTDYKAIVQGKSRDNSGKTRVLCWEVTMLWKVYGEELYVPKPVANQSPVVECPATR